MSVYVPSSENTIVAFLPLSHTRVSPAALMSIPPSPTCTNSSLNTIGVTPSGLTPVSWSFAPSISRSLTSTAEIGTLMRAIVVVVDSVVVDAAVVTAVVVVVEAAEVVVSAAVDVVVSEGFSPDLMTISFITFPFSSWRIPSFSMTSPSGEAT